MCVWLVRVCVCLYLSANSRRAPRKEILHQFRPDYRSERDQCQKARSGVMWPNGKTSRGLLNGNEYTMWAQGGMSRRVGEGGRRSRDQTGEEGDITTVWEKTGRCVLLNYWSPHCLFFHPVDCTAYAAAYCDAARNKEWKKYDKIRKNEAKLHYIKEKQSSSLKINFNTHRCWTEYSLLSLSNTNQQNFILNSRVAL